MKNRHAYVRCIAFLLTAIQILPFLFYTVYGKTEDECRVISHGEPGKGRIALTFDDGPHTDHTPEILDILRECDVKATFFVVGANAEARPDLIDRLISEGHEIGNHTYNHRYLGSKNNKITEFEIEMCDSMIFQHSEYCSRLFRPPGGIMNSKIAEVCASYGYDIMLWSIDTKDWAGRSSDEIKKEILDNISDGAVILMHDGVKTQSADALKTLIPILKKQGFEFVTASELLK